MSISKTIGFIGGGQMCTALMGGLVKSKAIRGDQVTVSDPKPATLSNLQERYGVFTTTDNNELVKRSDIVTLCVKPSSLSSVLKSVAHTVDVQRHLIVSICAGVTCDTISSYLPFGTRVIRVMPNTPALVGAGASGYCLGDFASAEDSEAVKTMMSSVGAAYEVKEKDIDAVTGVSGSGPAYVFMFIEALADGGVRAGLPRQVALSLAAQTVLGGAQMVLESGLHPAILKDSVASPAGTTIAAIHALEKGGFRHTVMDAVVASAERSHEISLLAQEQEKKLQELELQKAQKAHIEKQNQ